MLRILCPTDFSNNSRFAAEYAIELGNELVAKLIFISSYKVPRVPGALRSLDDKIYEAVEEDLQYFIKKLHPLIKTGIEPEAKVVAGNTSDSIISFANENEIDLIVMGTKGSSSIMHMILGSVTIKFIEKSKIPILAIPYSSKFELHSNKILVALDSKGINNTKSLDLLSKLHGLPGCSIDVFHVIIPGEKVRLSSNSGMLNDIVDNIIEVDGIDPVKEIKNFVDKNDIGMLAMVGRKHSFLERAFVESNTISELFSSNVPVLVLPESRDNLV